MKKKFGKLMGIVLLIILSVIAISNAYNWFVSGKQKIIINTASKVYNNSDLFLSVVAQKDNTDIESNTKIRLLDIRGKKVKNAEVKYSDTSNAIISIPDVKPGAYFIEAKVSSKIGKDKIKKEIMINKSRDENITISLDKGIYKPGDTVNYRALTTRKNTDTPVQENVNVCIYDGNDIKVFNENFKTSEYGIIGGKFNLADEVNSGLYKLVIKTENSEETKQFKVNPYVTPKYELKVEYDKDNYLVGDTAKININAKYFFGEPVQNADLKIYVDNKEEKQLKTDDQGNAVFEKKIENAKKHKIKVEAIDTSNYFVEEESSFVAGTDIFSIQLLPEFGTLINGKNNDIYVLTSKNDGTPLKTYVTVSSDKYTKQIATDENGIGKFTIEINEKRDISNKVRQYDYRYDYNIDYEDEAYSNYKIQNSGISKSFSIVAQDMDGKQLDKNISLNVENRSTLLSTEKVKYEQGEEIRFKIQSDNEKSKNVYFIKNDKLIKMITTDSEQSSVNLGDEYGLIDILVTNNTAKNYYYNFNNKDSFKRTIFVKPRKALQIGIGTDKEEYKPGDNIEISFNPKDEANTSIDTALLVSMLDNSILSLANNDLSIDNIKLALEDISFSDELDAATLYSCLVNDSSEQTIMALLLKQKNRNVNVSETSFDNYDEREISGFTSIIAVIGIITIAMIMLCIKYKKTRNIVKHILNFLVLDFILVWTSNLIIDEFFWNIDYSVWVFIITSILGLAFYILGLARIEEHISRTTISLLISIALLLGIVYIFEMTNVSPITIIVTALIISLAILILAIVLKIAEKKKNNEKYKRIITKVAYIVFFVVTIIIAVIVSLIIANIINMIELSTPVAIILIYVLNYFFHRLRHENKKKKKSISYAATIFIGVIALVDVLGIGLILYNELSGTTMRMNLSNDLDAIPMESNFNSSGRFVPNTTTSSSGQKSSLLDSAESFLSKYSTDAIQEDTSIQQEIRNTDIKNETSNEETTDQNVRNIFLESMCFVPELVTQNGSAKLAFKLSDNITTWTIQAVGNTKDGRIGYGSIDNVRVFKDFFVDFELPKNLIETDDVSIPVTVYNYTDRSISTNIKVKEEDWFTIKNNNVDIDVEAKSTSMVYVPIKVLKAGDNKFRAEISSNNITDIVEKECKVSPNGYKVEKVVSTGRLEEDISEDILILDEMIENTAKVKVKVYPSAMSQTIEGMENIFRMPTGCFEQISSSLYPNILALKYLEDNDIVNEEIRQKALSYISSGYQKLLTYEVKGESGGYSLYGNSPAETVLTAYGLMEISDLSKVYNVDSTVIDKMTNYLYKKQNSNGSFTITGYQLGGASSSEELALNSYITWALSESNPKDERLKKSVEYLKGKLDKIDDNYSLALIANTLANVNDKDLNSLLKRIVNNVQVDGKKSYITSNVVDYYGSRYNRQTIQTVALTSMALSKSSYKPEINRSLINYLIEQKDTYGTWYNTQATILALRAINTNNDTGRLANQTLKVRLNSEEQKAEIKENPIGIYEFNFKNINKENKLNIDIEKGNAYYEVVEEHYIPFEKVDTSSDKIKVKVDGNFDLNVNDILKSRIQLINVSGNSIENGMVTISIPQGFTVVEESLSKLESNGIIEKYEMTYSKVNIYLRRFDANQIVNLETEFRAGYPVEITGLDVRAYDYYNPEIEGKILPIKIKVNSVY